MSAVALTVDVQQLVAEAAAWRSSSGLELESLDIHIRIPINTHTGTAATTGIAIQSQM